MAYKYTAGLFSEQEPEETLEMYARVIQELSDEVKRLAGEVHLHFDISVISTHWRVVDKEAEMTTESMFSLQVDSGSS